MELGAVILGAKLLAWRAVGRVSCVCVSAHDRQTPRHTHRERE
jgi:hypothetical protein